MNATADLRAARFAVRPLTPKLGAEISGVEPGGRRLRRRCSQAHLPGVPALSGAAVPAAGPSARPSGRVRPSIRRSADPRDEPVSRRWLSRSSTGCRISTSTAQPNGKHPDKGTLCVAHRRLVVGASPARQRSFTARSFRTVGGETHFCDMYGAYERLDSAWKARIADLARGA